MKCDERNCWGCAWRAITGPGDDPTLCCGHTSRQVRNNFGGYTTAETCKAYLQDDPSLKIEVKRDTRETLMKSIHQMVVNSGNFAAAEAILDYFSPDTYGSPSEIACDDFNVVTEVQFGGNEGIYLDCYAEGRIQPECEKKRWHLGTYKTLATSLSAMQTLGALGGSLTYFASEYLWENDKRFLSDRDLRIRALQKRQKEKEAEKP